MFKQTLQLICILLIVLETSAQDTADIGIFDATADWDMFSFVRDEGKIRSHSGYLVTGEYDGNPIYHLHGGDVFLGTKLLNSKTISAKMEWVDDGDNKQILGIERSAFTYLFISNSESGNLYSFILGYSSNSKKYYNIKCSNHYSVILIFNAFYYIFNQP